MRNRQLFFLDAKTSGGVALRVDVHAEYTLAAGTQICPQIHHGGGFSHAAFLVGNCIHNTHAGSPFLRCVENELPQHTEFD